jgi:DNA-binding NtrC family response regulator
VFTVSLPPLRDRKEDLPLLVDAFGGERLWDRLPETMRDQFSAHTWPGNVRELRNAIERARHMADIPELSGEALLREYTVPAGGGGEVLSVSYDGPFKDLKDDLIRSFEREYLTRLLSNARGNIAKAAREAGLDRKHLYSLLHKYGLAQSEAE